MTPQIPSQSIRDAYSPERFQAEGTQAIQQLATYLEKCLSRELSKVIHWAPPEQARTEWSPHFPGTPTHTANEFIDRILKECTRIHHPHYVGHQVSAPLPLHGVTDLLVSLLNNSSAIYEMGRAGVMAEKAVIQFLSQLLGYPGSADGIFTSGGSIGNLTALLTMRRLGMSQDIWKNGQRPSDPLPAVLVSGQAHYSISRAVQIMGWGEGGVIPVPPDDLFRMDVSQLEPTLEKARKANRQVIGVVASSCSTATGSYDPLEPIADFCKKHGLWMHADGAHGASVAFSKKYRHLIQGIEHADSVIWDAHKMMLFSSLNTAVLFKDGNKSYDVFSQEASYLFDSPAREEWFNPAHRTVECTRPALGLKIYVSLSIHGTQVFTDFVDRTHDLAKNFSGMIRERKNFELLIEPQSNIVCFRFLPEQSLNPEELNLHQSQIKQKIIEEGEFYLIKTTIKGKTYLRTSLMNPFTTENDLEKLLNKIAETSKLL